MSQRLEIKKSPVPIEIQTGLVALVALLLFLTTSKIVVLINNIIPSDTQLLAVVIKVLALGVAAGAVAMTWFRETRQKYYLEGSSIVLQNMEISGRKGEAIINPKHAPKIALSRSFFGRRFDYGDIILEIDSYSHKNTYHLKNVAHPEKVITELRSRL